MPDPRCILCAAVLALVPNVGAAQDCTPRLSVSAVAADRLAMDYTDPCAPYAAVSVALGPLVFGDQTGRAGGLRLDLPALPGGGSLAVTRDGVVTRAPLPAPTGPIPTLAAVSWPDAPPPDLPGARLAGSGHGAAPRRLGFPGETPVIDVLRGAMGHIDLPLGPATCGRRIAAQIVTRDGIRDLRVTLPDCGGPVGALRIPLDP